MTSNNKNCRQKKVGKAIKATIPLMFLMGGGAAASTRSRSSFNSIRSFKSLPAVVVTKRDNTKNEPQKQVSQAKRSAFGAFTNKSNKTAKTAKVEVNQQALAFLQQNDLLTSNESVNASLSGNTLGRKIFVDFCHSANANGMAHVPVTHGAASKNIIQNFANQAACTNAGHVWNVTTGGSCTTNTTQTWITFTKFNIAACVNAYAWAKNGPALNPINVVNTVVASSNAAPSDISLTSLSVNQADAVNATVGVLSSTDTDNGDSHTYSLATGTGDTDNGSFNIDGANLRANDASALTAGTYSIRINTNDGTADFQKQFTITVVDTTAPVFQSVTPAINTITPSGATLSVNLNEDGTVYYVIVANGAGEPSAAQVKTGNDSTGSSAITSGSFITTATSGSEAFSGLTGNTSYDIYVVAQDNEGTPNLQATATKVDFTTANTTPTIAGAPASITVVEDAPSNVDLSAITFADIDGDALTVTLTVNVGTIASADGSGTFGSVTIANSGTSAMTLSGTATNIHSYLDTVSNIKYTTAANDTTSRNLAIKANDGTIDSSISNITLNITDIADISSNTVPSNSTFGTGTDLDFIVTFDEPVTVTGTPRIALNIGGTTKYATYESGSLGTTLTFRYTVEAGLNDADGISVTSTIDTNGGSIIDTDGDGSGADLSNLSFASTAGVKVDALAPTISEVTAVTSFTNDSTPNVVFTTNETGTITLGGSCGTSSSKIISATGNHTLVLTQPNDSTALADATYTDCTLTLNDGVNNSNTITLSSFEIDTLDPTQDALVPADNATSIDKSANLSLDLNDEIALGSGNITIKKTSDNTAVATIDVASHGGQLSISNDALTINPTADLPENIELYVLVDATAIDDTAGNSYAGIASTTAWSFTTADVTPPSVTGITVKGISSAGDASMQFTVVFDETANNVSTDDFTVATASGTASGNVSAVSSATGSSIDVTVDTITGTGSIRLDFNANSDIVDDSGNGNNTNGYSAAYTSGTSHSVDRDAPTTVATPDLDAASDSGTSNSDNKTTDTTPTFSGTAESGATVKLYSDKEGAGSTVIGSATATGGSWSITSIALTDDLTHNITATATDAAGNISTPSSALTVEIDNTAPTGYSATINSDVNVGNQSSSGFTFVGAEVGTSYSYTISSDGGGTDVTGNGTITTATDNISAIDLSGLGDGTLSLSVTLTDAAGNAGNPAIDSANKDTVGPSFQNSTPNISATNLTGTTLNVDLNEDGRTYYVVLQDGATAPSVNEVLTGTGSGGSGAVRSGNFTTSATIGSTAISSLTPATDYDIYVVAQDDESTANVQSSVIKLDLTTLEDADATLTVSGIVSERAGLPSTADTSAEAVNLLDFTLSDGGTADGLAMNISALNVNVSGTASTAELAKITWLLNGPNASNVSGSYSGGIISFSGLSISVADSTAQTYTLSAYYNDNTALIDGHSIILSIDGDSDVTVSSGTSMGTTSAVTNGSGSLIDITATKLVFNTEPSYTSGKSGAELDSQPKTAAQDEAGNLDIDFNADVTLTASPSTLFSSSGELSATAAASVNNSANGYATFNDIGYRATSDGESFTVTADASGLTSVTSSSTTVDVAATKFNFATEPAPLTVASGITTHLTTVPVVEAVDANGIKDTDFTNNVTLIEINGAGNAIMTQTGDLDGNAADGSVQLAMTAGSATFSDMTINYTTSGASNESFNLQASGSITLATSSLLTGTVDPEIDISGSSVAIIDGDTTPQTPDNTDFGSSLVSTGSVAKTFTIANNGSELLTLSGNVLISGSHASDFSVTSQPPASVAVSGSQNFEITFDASDSGVRTAIVTVNSDDADEAAYTFAIQGTGIAASSVASINRVSSEHSNAASVAFTVTFASSSTGVSASNFDLTTNGLTGASITNVTGSGTTYTVTVNTGSGDGTLRLDVTNDTNLVPDLNDEPYTSGQSYIIDKTVPVDATSPVISSDGYVNHSERSGVTLSGTAEANSTVELTFTDGTNTPVTITVTADANGNWSITDSDALDISSLNDGNIAISIVTTDSAGNQSTATTNLIKDTVAPSEPVVSSPSTAMTVHATTQAITGTHDEDTISIHAYLDADKNGVADNSVSQGSGTVGTNTSKEWSLAANLSVDSDNDFVLIASDTAGNLSAPVSVSTITEDSAAPVVTINNLTTNDTTPTLTGTVDDTNATVVITVDSANYTATNNGNGTWTLADNVISHLADSTYDVVATATDLYTNASADSSSDELVIDTAAPSGYSVTIDQSLIDANNDSAFSFTFAGAEVGSSYNYSISNGSGPVTGSGSIVTSTDVIGPIDVSGIAEGNLALSATLTDSANNLGTAATDTTTKLYNKAPTITQGASTTVSMDEDSSPNPFALSLNASDLNGDTLTWSISSAASHGTAVVTGAGNSKTISYTPVANFNGSDSFVVSVSDSNSQSEMSDSITVNVTINPINDAPLFTSTAITSATQGSPYAYSISASDIDNASLTISATTKPNWLVLNDNGNGSATLSGTPSDDDVTATNSLVLALTDGSTTVNQNFTISVANINDAPVISGSPTTTVAEDAAYSFTPTVIDVDNGDTKTFSISNKPSWATFNTTSGLLSGTPTNDNIGTSSNIVITVTDGSNVSASLSAFNLTVTNENDAPVISGSPATTVAEDAAYSFTPTVTDVDSGDTKVFNISNKPSWVTFSTATGLLSGTPTNDDVGATTGIVITVTDGSEVAASLEAFELTVTNVNDAPVAENDTLTITANSDDLYTLSVLGNDSDVDGDELVIEGADADLGNVTVVNNELVYQADADFIGTVKLTYSINDGNDARDSGILTLTIEDAVQSQAPTITVPDDVTVNATGLYTKVTTGIATATDQNGAPIAVSLVDNNLLFSPGVHEIYWQATDALGVRSVASQQVIVHPLVSLNKDQIIYEGNEVEVQVILNGSAPSYPITLPYTITGTADNGDHDAVDGEVTINEGLVGSIRFSSLLDSDIEADESVIVTLASGLNLGNKVSTEVVISENNIAPVLTFSIEQSGEIRQTVSQEDGVVTIQATLTDANPGDTVTVVWTSETLVNTDNDETIFSFAPEDYTAGSHSLTAVATDNGEPNLSVTTHIFVDIKATLAVLTNEQDTDGDNIPDKNEGYGDDDGDGIPNYQDSQKLETCNVVPETLNTQTQFLVEGEPGVCLRKGTVSQNSAQGGLQLNEAELAAPDTVAKNVGGLFDYIAYGLPQAGQVYKIVFPQLLPIPRGAVYRKYSNDAWTEFVVDNDNKLMSVTGEQGYCPPPGDDSWVEGLQENSWCVQLQIQDGGPNDDDGIANGTIIDPGGVSVLLNGNTFPIARDDSVSLIQNNEVTVAVLNNDSDVDGDTLTVANASADFGAVIVNGQESITYTPAMDYVGNDTVTYTINDGNGGTAVAQVNITVNVPDAGVIRNKSQGGGSMSWFFSCGLFLVAVGRKYGKRALMIVLAGLSFNSQASDDVVISNELANKGVKTSEDTALVPNDMNKWSIAVNTGVSRLHGSSNLAGIPPENIVDIDDKGISWGIALGYQMTSKWSISFGYLDLGEAETVLQSNTFNYHQTVAQVTPVFGDGIVLGLNYQFWQHSKLSSEVMAGAFAWRSEIDSTFEGVTLEHKQEGVDLYAGLALAYALSNDWKLGLEAKRYFLDVNDVDNFSLTLAYQF